MHSATESGRSGPRPVILKLDRDVKRSLRTAKSQGCWAVVVEIVSSADGHVLSPDIWRILHDACEALGMILVADESMSAVRCGYPFAHLDPKYGGRKPTFVLFGKGFRTAGLAVHHDGCLIRKRLVMPDGNKLLDGAAQLFDIVVSEPVAPATLIEAHDALRKAIDQDFCGRANLIGTILRGYIDDIHGRRSSTRFKHSGMGALIFLPSTIAAASGLVPAASGSMVRWMPYLDEGMADPNLLQSLFGPGGFMYDELVKHIASTCIMCGKIVAEQEELVKCDVCGGYICPSCAVAPLYKTHIDGKCLDHARTHAHT